MAYQAPVRKRRKVLAEINVVPFIDVMLVLLVIFMITTPLLTQGVKVDLPKTTAKVIPPEKKEPIILTIDSDGNYFLNTAEKPNVALSSQALQNVASLQLKNNESDGRPVLVRGDKTISYGRIMAAMVLLQNAGAKSVGLITQDEKTTP
jgi:biopolymer transport protein TolR